MKGRRTGPVLSPLSYYIRLFLATISLLALLPLGASAHDTRSDTAPSAQLPDSASVADPLADSQDPGSNILASALQEGKGAAAAPAPLSAGGWATLADAPAQVKHGGALAYAGGDYIYAFRGDDTRGFWQYSISTDSWTALADAPDRVKEGGALTHAGGDYIYALQGKGQPSFWQ